MPRQSMTKEDIYRLPTCDNEVALSLTSGPAWTRSAALLLLDFLTRHLTLNGFVYFRPEFSTQEERRSQIVSDLVRL